MPLRVCYHGTGKENVLGILRDGFREGTYFARHLEDAIGYGGPHVFAVVFRDSELPANWQFISRSMVPPSRITHYRVYQVREVACNERLKNDVFESNMDMGPDWCDRDY